MNWLERASAEGVQGFLHPNELEMLIELSTGKDVLEIGSFMGLSAWGMAHTSKSVMCVDTFRANTAGQNQMNETTTLNAFLKATSTFQNISYFQGTSEEASLKIPGDWEMIFLDAMHTYDEVLADLNRWWPRLRCNGILAMHDYGHSHFDGVQKAADEFFKRPPDAEPVVTLAWWIKQ